MKKLILLIIMVSTSILASAQQHKADEQMIGKQLDAFLTSWKNHDFSDIAQYATVDCDWVNVVGMWWKNRKEVQFAHQAFHNGMFKNTPLSTVSASMRFVTQDVAVVHWITKVGAYYPPDGVDRGGNKQGDDTNIALLVFVKKDGKWLLTSAENLPINEHAAASDPVLKMN